MNDGLNVKAMGTIVRCSVLNFTVKSHITLIKLSIGNKG